MPKIVKPRDIAGNTEEEEAPTVCSSYLILTIFVRVGLVLQELEPTICSSHLILTVTVPVGLSYRQNCWPKLA